MRYPPVQPQRHCPMCRRSRQPRQSRCLFLRTRMRTQHLTTRRFTARNRPAVQLAPSAEPDMPSISPALAMTSNRRCSAVFFFKGTDCPRPAQRRTAASLISRPFAEFSDIVRACAGEIAIKPLIKVLLDFRSPVEALVTVVAHGCLRRFRQLSTTDNLAPG